MSDKPGPKYDETKCVEQAREALQMADKAVMLKHWYRARRDATNALAWIKAAQSAAETEKE